MPGEVTASERPPKPNYGLCVTRIVDPYTTGGRGDVWLNCQEEMSHNNGWFRCREVTAVVIVSEPCYYEDVRR